MAWMSYFTTLGGSRYATHHSFLRSSGVIPPVCGRRYLAMKGTELPSAKRRQTEAATDALPLGQSGASTAGGVHENTGQPSLLASSSWILSSSRRCLLRPLESDWVGFSICLFLSISELQIQEEFNRQAQLCIIQMLWTFLLRRIHLFKSFVTYHITCVTLQFLT